MRQETIDATVASVSNKAVGAGSAVTVVSWFNSSNLGVWAGIAIGLAGLLVNWYYKHQNNKRADATHKAHLRAIEAGVEKREIDRLG